MSALCTPEAALCPPCVRLKPPYVRPASAAPRIVDKLLVSTLIWTLYFGVGNDFSPENWTNIAARTLSGHRADAQRTSIGRAADIERA